MILYQRDSMKTLYWDDVLDDHKCINCGKTKHEGVNFSVIALRVVGLSVKLQCNSCRGKGLTHPRKKKIFATRRKAMARDENTIREIKERIDEYFKNKH